MEGGCEYVVTMESFHSSKDCLNARTRQKGYGRAMEGQHNYTTAGLEGRSWLENSRNTLKRGDASQQLNIAQTRSTMMLYDRTLTRPLTECLIQRREERRNKKKMNRE